MSTGAGDDSPFPLRAVQRRVGADSAFGYDTPGGEESAMFYRYDDEDRTMTDRASAVVAEAYSPPFVYDALGRLP